MVATGCWIAVAVLAATACDGSPLWDLPQCHPSFDEAAGLGFLVGGNTDGVDPLTAHRD